jgi:hypothetical protein
MAPTPISANRELQQRRISRATKGLAVASVVATAVFGLAAAHTGKPGAGSDGATQGDDGPTAFDDDFSSSSSLSPSQSAPSRSFEAPVTSSGGS